MGLTFRFSTPLIHQPQTLMKLSPLAPARSAERCPVISRIGHFAGQKSQPPLILRGLQHGSGLQSDHQAPPSGWWSAHSALQRSWISPGLFYVLRVEAQHLPVSDATLSQLSCQNHSLPAFRGGPAGPLPTECRDISHTGRRELLLGGLLLCALLAARCWFDCWARC